MITSSSSPWSVIVTVVTCFACGFWLSPVKYSSTDERSAQVPGLPCRIRPRTSVAFCAIVPTSRRDARIPITPITPHLPTSCSCCGASRAPTPTPPSEHRQPLPRSRPSLRCRALRPARRATWRPPLRPQAYARLRGPARATPAAPATRRSGPSPRRGRTRLAPPPARAHEREWPRRPDPAAAPAPALGRACSRRRAPRRCERLLRRFALPLRRREVRLQVALAILHVLARLPRALQGGPPRLAPVPPLLRRLGLREVDQHVDVRVRRVGLERRAQVLGRDRALQRLPVGVLRGVEAEALGDAIEVRALGCVGARLVGVLELLHLALGRVGPGLLRVALRRHRVERALALGLGGVGPGLVAVRPAAQRGAHGVERRVV